VYLHLMSVMLPASGAVTVVLCGAGIAWSRSEIMPDFNLGYHNGFRDNR
jgi:hypothetical protein